MTDWKALADRALGGDLIAEDDALAMLAAPDDELLELLAAGFRIRRHYFGRKLRLNLLISARTGNCSEDCAYCSQSRVSEAPIAKHPLLDRETLLAGARRAVELQAGTYCMVTSGRRPGPRELDELVDAVKAIRAEGLPLRLCCSLGMLDESQAARLRDAGVDRYNHNINTSREHHPHITSTHTYDDRVATIRRVMAEGISSCSGVLVGMQETDRDIYQMAVALRELAPESIPVNFLHAVPGTPLGECHELDPRRCLRILAVFRFVCPDREIRVAGGREVNLRSLQPLAFYLANSMFVGDYLTTRGAEPAADYAMIEDLGFEIEHTGKARFQA